MHFICLIALMTLVKYKHLYWQLTNKYILHYLFEFHLKECEQFSVERYSKGMF